MKSFLKKKRDALEEVLRGLGSVLIAFSGGTDSTFLLSAAHTVLGDKVVGVIGRSSFHPEPQYEAALTLAETLGIECLTLDLDAMGHSEITKNPPERCYHCKKLLFTEIKKLAWKRGVPWVAEGTHADDRNDFRPGEKALAELGIRSPLREVNLTKAEIRALSREQGLSTWDKRAESCLACRFPYGEEITLTKLKQVEAAEGYLRSLGFSGIRVRYHQNLARIEVGPPAIRRFLNKDLRGMVVQVLTALGFTYVALDLQGYRRGSMNEVLPSKREVVTPSK